MTHTKSLKTYPNMREACAGLDDLYDQYLKVNKRKPSVELTVAATFSPNPRPSATPEQIEIRIRFEKGQEAEVKWFEETVK